MTCILVTGAEGTLGTRLVKQLQKKGNSVFGIDLKHTHEKHHYRCDIRNFRKLEEIFQSIEPDFVYHLAAEFGRINGEENYEDLWSTNLIGTRNIAELCIEYGSKLIFASSSEIYGEIGTDLLYENLSEQYAIKQKNDYALSKWANEVQLKNLVDKKKLKLTTLRFFNAYGPGEKYHPYRSVVALFCYSALNDIPYTVYNGYYRTFMYVDDFIPTLSNVYSEFGVTQNNTINIGGADYRSVKEVSDLALKLSGKTDKLVTYLPEEKHNITSKKPDISLAKRFLGHNPTITIDIGIQDTILWMKDYYGND